MLVLVSDFGVGGPYLGQMKAVLLREAPGVPVIDLFTDAPVCNPRASAYLLAAYCSEFAAGSVFLAVVDPGVGTAVRRPLLLEADGRWFVGPDNGLLSIVARRAATIRCWDITWRPARLSASFHGRDLFAPVAAMVARGELPAGKATQPLAVDWPDELREIVYIDHFGNALSGMRAAALSPVDRVRVGGQLLPHAEIFGAVERGAGFWYENANGLLEIAVNQGRAAERFGLAVGDAVEVVAARAGR